MNALGRAVGNINACKHLKIQAKEVGRLRHGCKGSTTTGECFEIPKMEHKKTTHAVYKNTAKEQWAQKIRCELRFFILITALLKMLYYC